MMLLYEHWAVAVATFSLTLIMEGECSNSSADTVLHEDFCNINNIPLCLKKGATTVPERTGEYSFVFLVSLFNQVSETPSGDALDSGVPASAGVLYYCFRANT